MKILILFALPALFLVSCSKDKLTASGDNVTETRTPGSFTGINTNGSTPVHLTYGSEYKVVLKGSNNLIPYFQTKVAGATLYLEYEKANVQHDDLEVYVTLPQCNYISINGSGRVDLNGEFSGMDAFKLTINGSGNAEVGNSVIIKKMEVNISGSGNANLEKFDIKEADVHISGSGDVRIKVQDRLKARISGSGKIYYKGNPQIDSQISGSGKVIPF